MLFPNLRYMFIENFISITKNVDLADILHPEGSVMPELDSRFIWRNVPLYIADSEQLTLYS